MRLIPKGKNKRRFGTLQLRRKEALMTKPKNICPFTDTPCSTCRILFADDKGEKSGKSAKGCQLAEKTTKGSNT